MFGSLAYKITYLLTWLSKYFFEVLDQMIENVWTPKLTC